MSITLAVGMNPSRVMEHADVEVALKEHLMLNQTTFEYIRLDGDKWEIQLKTPYGKKAVIRLRPLGNEMQFDVVLC